MDYGSAGVWMLENLRSKKYDTEATVDPTFQTLFDNTPAGFAYTTNAPRWANPGIAGGNGTDSKYFEMDQSLGLLYNIPAVFGLKGSLHATHNIQGLALSRWMENTIIQ